MATNLQVNASTQQAVGAFDALTASINRSRTAFDRMNATANQGGAAQGNLANGITASTSAFNTLTMIVGKLFDVLTMVGAGIQFVFSSLLKEMDKIQGFNAIMSVTTKGAGEATAAYDFLRKTADRLGVQFDSLAGNYAKLVAALPEGNNRLAIAEKVFMGVAMAARTLHASNQDTQLMFYAVTQIASKGVVSMEELRRQLGEKLPGVLNIAAKALNTLPEELEKAIKKGVVISEKFLPIFGDALIRTFGDSSRQASESVSASINRLTNVWVDFVKAVLDSGAGNSIVAMFDALRKKLSDPYLIQRFADLVKYLADKFTQFIQNISEEEIRNGFDTFIRGMELAVVITEKLIKAVSWLINELPKLMQKIGDVTRYMPGLGGSIGRLIGSAGDAVAPTKETLANRVSMDANAQLAKAQQTREQELLKFNQLIPLLQQFKGLNTMNGLENLFKAENLNTKTLTDLNQILKDPRFKTEKDRANSVREYAKGGVVLGPTDSTLADVMGAGKPKKNREAGLLDATANRAAGLNPDFFKEWERLNVLVSQNRMNTDELKVARDRLLSKQPVIIEGMKLENKELSAFQKGTNAQIDSAMKYADLREQINDDLNDQLTKAGTSQENLKIEADLIKIVNQFEDKKLTLTKDQITAYRERLQLIKETADIQSAKDAVLSQTVDKYKPQIDQVKGIRAGLADPSSGLTQPMATDLVVQQDPNMVGSADWMEGQKRAMEDYYAYLQLLRNENLISEDTMYQAQVAAFNKYAEVRIQQASSFFGQMSSLMSSTSRRAFEIGKAAAIAQAIVDGIASVQKALASAAPPYSYALAAAAAVNAGMNVNKIRSTTFGYEMGGYTGNVGRGQIAGVTHGQEFVVNAAATARNRQTLEAMNRGSGDTSQKGVNLVVNNMGTPQDYQVEQISRDEIRIIARDVTRQEAPNVVAGEIANPNSKVSKSLGKNTQGGSRRR